MRNGREDFGIAKDRLPAGTALKPIQLQDCIAGIPQPSSDFFWLKRPIARFKVPIQQLCDFLSGARFLDLVQRSPYVFVETAIRIGKFAHLRSGFEKPMGTKRAHLLFALRYPPRMSTQEKLVGTNCRINLRIASGSCSPEAPAKLYVRSNPFGPSTRISQFSLARDPAMDTRHSPRRSLKACSILATISRQSSGSPRLCNSTVTAIAVQLYRRGTAQLVGQSGESQAGQSRGPRCYKLIHLIHIYC